MLFVSKKFETNVSVPGRGKKENENEKNNSIWT